MIKPDKTKAYDLKGLDEEQFSILNSNLVKLKDAHWRSMTFKYLKSEGCYILHWINKAGWCLTDMYDSPTTNAIELFYTLDNVQVDCRGLHEMQIDNMASIFKANGYNIWADKDALKSTSDYTHLYYNYVSKLFLIDRKQENKYEITYKKFIELFSNKEFKELNLHNIKIDISNCNEEKLERVIAVFKRNGLKHCFLRKPFSRKKDLLIAAVMDLGNINYVEISFNKFIELFGEDNEQNFKDFGIAKVELLDNDGNSETIFKNNDQYGYPSITVRGEVFNPQPHYDNTNGSIYKIGTERSWNPYLFDVVKRLERGGKKDPLKQEIEKSIDVLKIWLNEL